MLSKAHAMEIFLLKQQEYLDTSENIDVTDLLILYVSSNIEDSIKYNFQNNSLSVSSNSHNQEKSWLKVIDEVIGESFTRNFQYYVYI